MKKGHRYSKQIGNNYGRSLLLTKHVFLLCNYTPFKNKLSQIGAPCTKWWRFKSAPCKLFLYWFDNFMKIKDYFKNLNAHNFLILKLNLSSFGILVMPMTYFHTRAHLTSLSELTDQLWLISWGHMCNYILYSQAGRPTSHFNSFTAR